MPRSSESVAALAAALAKAQAELINPEKSLVATLPAERGLPERSFRYASLAGGLEIVRKTLGEHEIAIVQSTAIDRDSGTINLTTTLAHASGQWMASDWPVCSLAEMPNPHRMGAALTYARRYGLFTLVGIAGEDDLDAPDLPVQPSSPAQNLGPPPSPGSHRKNGKSHLQPPMIPLDAETSGRQRDQLLVEVAAISCFEDAAAWAKRIIPIKNNLTAADAKQVEAALEEQLGPLQNSFEEARIPADITDRPQPDAPLPSPSPPSHDDLRPAAGRQTSPEEFEAYAVTPKTRRRRDKRHRQFVAAQGCVICGRQPSDAHHLRFAQARGLGLKVSDEFTVPLCRSHHRDLHLAGSNELRWWGQFGIEPKGIAAKLWMTSHPDPSATNPTPMKERAAKRTEATGPRDEAGSEGLKAAAT